MDKKELIKTLEEMTSSKESLLYDFLCDEVISSKMDEAESITNGSVDSIVEYLLTDVDGRPWTDAEDLIHNLKSYIEEISSTGVHSQILHYIN